MVTYKTHKTRLWIIIGPYLFNQLQSIRWCLKPCTGSDLPNTPPSLTAGTNLGGDIKQLSIPTSSIPTLTQSWLTAITLCLKRYETSVVLFYLCQWYSYMQVIVQCCKLQGMNMQPCNVAVLLNKCINMIITNLFFFSFG